MYILDIMKNEYIDVYMKFLEKKNKKYIFFIYFLKKKVRADFNSSLFILSMSIHLFPSYNKQIVIWQQHYNCLYIQHLPFRPRQVIHACLWLTTLSNSSSSSSLYSKSSIFLQQHVKCIITNSLDTSTGYFDYSISFILYYNYLDIDTFRLH